MFGIVLAIIFEAQKYIIPKVQAISINSTSVQ